MAMNLPERLKQIESAVVDLLALRPNWDSYHANQIRETAIEAALTFTLTPMPGGGIDMWWNGEEVSIEFDADGRIRAVMWERKE